MVAAGTVVGDYVVEAPLGRGGMGEVVRAQHVDSGRVVALKLLSDRADTGARLEREGRVQASLDHPHIVTVYEAGDSERGPWLAMRLVDGPSLAQLLESREVDVARALRLLAQVAEALDAAHAAGLVHRDVKPSNVLVGPGDHAYLADFGLTRAGGSTALTATGAIAGTVAYLAPEVAQGQEATPASDRYALAAVAFECLSGGTVFPRPTDAAVLLSHAADPPPAISRRRPELGTAVDGVFERGLAKNPRERPGSAEGLIGDLRRALERDGAATLPAPPPVGVAALGPALETAEHAVVARAPASRRGATVLTAMAAALGGAAIVAAAWALTSAGDPAETPVAAAEPAAMTFVGSDLADGPARAVDCRGLPPTSASPECTIAQAQLPDATLVVRRNGVIRRWSVRGATGELTLVVLRPRADGAFQIATSATESVGSANLQTFATDVDVERGDRVGLRVAPGSAVGVRETPGATTDRWLPALKGVVATPDAGVEGEVLLRVGIVPGARSRAPRQVTGSAAASLPAGKILARRQTEVGARDVELRAVEVGGGLVLDLVSGGRRLARVEVPGARAGAQIVQFLAAVWTPEQAGVDLDVVNAGSARVVQHTYVVQDRGFILVR